MKFTLWGKNFSKTTDEVRAEAARLLHEADKADREANKPPNMLFVDGIVTKDTLQQAAAQIRSVSPKEHAQRADAAWIWLKRYLVQIGAVKLVCTVCKKNWSNGFCYCTFVGNSPSDQVGIRLSDLARLKGRVVSKKSSMPRPVRDGVIPFYEYLDHHRVSSS